VTPVTRDDWDSFIQYRYCPGATMREWSQRDGTRHKVLEYRGDAMHKTDHPDGTTTYYRYNPRTER